MFKFLATIILMDNSDEKYVFTMYFIRLSNAVI